MSFRLDLSNVYGFCVIIIFVGPRLLTVNFDIELVVKTSAG